MNLEARRDAYDRDCQALIAEHGWMIQGVFSTETDPGMPFHYTVGLTVAGLPELVISGLPDETAGALLNDATQRHLGTELKAGELIDGIASVAFQVIEAPTAEVNMARHLYGADKVTALQLVWPDDKGSYPGEAGWKLGDMQELFR